MAFASAWSSTGRDDILVPFGLGDFPVPQSLALCRSLSEISF
jgi:hypothetical protein